MDAKGLAAQAYDTMYGGERNLSMGERIGSVVLGLAALGTAARQRPLAGLLLAGAGLALVGRGTSGHCAMKAAMTGREERATQALPRRTARTPALDRASSRPADEALQTLSQP